jgi:hypothetical protein
MKLTHSLKLADPGKIVQTGISAGSRKAPSIDWVQNILSKRLSGDDIDKLDRETAHVFSLFWMLIRRRLPREISDDLVNWLTETGIHRMNKDVLCGFQEEGSFGEIELDIGNNLFNLKWAEYAPPSGVMAANYSRHFLVLFFLGFLFSYHLDRYVHREQGQPHKFAISWTVARTLADEQGGHFYNCEYGIRVKGGDDTVVAWDPGHFHGTSLQDYLPTSQTISDFNQIGLAIATPSRLPQLWKRYAEKKMTLQQLKEEVESDDEDDGEA